VSFEAAGRTTRSSDSAAEASKRASLWANILLCAFGDCRSVISAKSRFFAVLSGRCFGAGIGIAVAGERHLARALRVRTGLPDNLDRSSAAAAMLERRV